MVVTPAGAEDERGKPEPAPLLRSRTSAYSSSAPGLTSFGCRYARPRRPLGIDRAFADLSLHAPASREPLTHFARTLLKLAELVRAQVRRGAALGRSSEAGKARKGRGRDA